MNDTTFQGNGSVKYVPVVVDTKPKPITNYDLLIRKTPEEMAAFHKSRGCPPLKSCPNIEELDGIPENGVCQKCWLDWLRKEVTDGEQS